MPTKPGHITPERAREINALRKRKAGGRPAIMRACPKCGATMTARDLWRHRCG